MACNVIHVYAYEECMDDGDSKIAKEAKLFDALEHKSVVIEVDNQEIAIFTKVPLRGFGEPFMSDYGRKMVNGVNVEIHGVKFKADFVVLDYVNEEEPSMVFGRDFLKLEAQAEKLSRWGKQTETKAITLKNSPPPFLSLEEIPPPSTVPSQPIYHPLTPNKKETHRALGREKSFVVPRFTNWHLFESYGFEDTLREMMKLEYIYKGDGDVFFDYSWERALLIDDEIYPEWVLGFFSTLYFDMDVDRTNLMKEKCIWFRLCRHEHILTLPEFTVVLGLYTEDEVEHCLFEIYFGKLEVNDKQFDHKNYWSRVDALDEENTYLKKEAGIPTEAAKGSSG
nr:hypothetical protein [Tanacetum cinerariifolium]